MNRVSRYCAHPDGNELVEHHLQIITEHLLAGELPIRSLVLIGSFGRGEGIIAKDESGTISPVNDYDIVIVVTEKLRWHQRMDLRLLRESLTIELGIWHLDFNVMTEDELKSPEMSMMRYDMKFGSQVFFGDEQVLDLVPFVRTDQISDQELLNLLVNRLVTFLEGHPMVDNTLTPPQKARQIAKVFFALLDSECIRHDCYQSLYREKFSQLEQLSLTDPLGEYLNTQRSLADSAWGMQLDGTLLSKVELLEFWESTLPFLITQIEQLTLGISKRQAEKEVRKAETLKNWRGKSLSTPILEAFVRLLRRKQCKVTTEKLLFAFLSAYPDGGYNYEVSKQLPALPSRSNQSQLSPLEDTKWCQFAKQLIDSWYNSV